jgi:hypothetical protein
MALLKQMALQKQKLSERSRSVPPVSEEGETAEHVADRCWSLALRNQSVPKPKTILPTDPLPW